MTLFGYPIESLYLILLAISGFLILLFILFGDIFEAIFESISFINPVLILAFIIFFSASGYVLENITSINSLIIIIISAIAAFILDIFLNTFVLIPMSTAEESLGYTEDSLKGRIGKIIIPVPRNGFGEIIIESKSGTISKPAASYDDIEIEEGEKVLIIEVKDGVLYVTPYDLDLETSKFD